MLAYRRLERIADEKDTILDIGTKDGNHLDAISGDVVGVDLNFDFPLRSDISSYIYADGCRLPFESNSFDYIVMNQVFEHVDDRESLITESARVLKADGLALFSFPNRFTFNRPHGLPRWLSFLPKAFGKQIARVVLPQKKFEYYATGVFPLSPIGARRLISASFGEIKYVTIDESVESPEIYGNSLAPRLFVFFLPLIHQIAAFPPFLSLFERIWPYVCYECTSPSG